MPNDGREPIRYEIRIDGHLDQHWADWFGGLTLTHDADGTTTLRGQVTDQPQLHGLLARIRDIGATLISVMPLEALGDLSTPDQQQP